MYLGQSACSAAELSCSFDSGQKCAWRNQDNNDVHWQKARLKQTLTKEQIRAVTERTDIPSNTDED